MSKVTKLDILSVLMFLRGNGINKDFDHQDQANGIIVSVNNPYAYP